MDERRYGLIRTLAPLHVGASAGEEAGTLNLIFRDPFTQTGIIPGSSIRGRFRAEMRRRGGDDQSETIRWYGSEAGKTEISEARVKFEYASLVWLPVFCPGQPVVWVSCPRLLRRYAAIVHPQGVDSLPEPFTCSDGLKGRAGEEGVAGPPGGGLARFRGLPVQDLVREPELFAKRSDRFRLGGGGEPEAVIHGEDDQ
jgi:CRISPR-associated protein Cmr4